MTVRAMRESDAVETSVLLAGSFPTEMAAFLPYAQAGAAQFLIDQLADGDPAKQFLVFDHGGRVAGFAEYRFDSASPMAFLAYVCVADWARRQGIAKALLEHFLSANNHLERLELDVFQENLPALRLYAGLGFTTLRQTAWFRRGLPESSVPLDIPEIAAMQATHARYGFSQCEFLASGEVRRAGRIGESVLRCYDERMFADDTLLASLRATFPSMTAAVLVGLPPDQGGLPGDVSVVVRAFRMVLEMVPNPAGSA